MTSSRRNFLSMVTLAPIMLVSARAAGAACYDPASLPLSQKNQRRGLDYIEASDDPNRRCELCAYFTVSQAACGNCQLLNGGPVNAGAVCASFDAKAA